MRKELYALDGSASDTRSLRGRIGVVLAEDHPMLRRTLRALIDAERDLKVVGEAAGLDAVMRQVRRDRPEVLVLDARIADGSCLEQVRWLRSLAPGTQIVVITMEENRALAEAALRAGATGFVLKDTAEQELCEAVRRAARERPYRSPRVVQR